MRKDAAVKQPTSTGWGVSVPLPFLFPFPLFSFLSAHQPDNVRTIVMPRLLDFGGLGPVSIPSFFFFFFFFFFSVLSWNN